MKKLNFALFLLGFGLLFSCNNTQKSSENLAKQKEDSIRLKDSVLSGDVVSDDKRKYWTSLKNQTDSMDFMLTHYDTIYESQNKLVWMKWQKNRSRISARTQRLKQKEGEIATVTKDNWTTFKQGVDTSVINLKNDWDNVLNDMKAKSY